MNVVQAGLWAEPVCAALVAVLACTLAGRSRALACGVGVAAIGVAGTVTGVAVLAGGSGEIRVPLVLVTGPMTYAPDALGAVFLLISSVVGLLSGVHGISYAHGAAASRTGWSALAVFLLGMQLVAAADDVVAFLFAWELMALGSTVLLLADHTTRASVASAGIWYSVMSHLSFVLLVAGFGVVAADAGGIGFDALARVSPTTWAGSVAFVLLTAGFATKAGLAPVHVWLPRAHPEAPSHASAAMSGAMVKLGVYGILLVCVRLMPGGPAWWGVVLMGLGGVSALYGILQAGAASDLKRLLAYSTTENVGLMVLAIGAAVLLASRGLVAAAGAALVACLLLAVSHAAFKATLFLAAGSVLYATGERDLDRLGGLGRGMPWTAAAFGVAALGAAALPVSAGFVAEWALLQSLIHGARPGDSVLAVLMPAAVAVIALTTGLALLTFVKAYGIGFLARSRTPEAEAAVEVPWTMRGATVVGAAAVVVLGLVPGPVSSVLADSLGVGGVSTVGIGGLDLSGLGALLDPAALAVLALAMAVPVVVASAILAARHPARRTDLAWGCGGARVSPRMQYTATSYAEPLVRVFDDALRPSRDLEVTHLEESQYLVQQIEFRQRVDDVVELRTYRPLVRWLDALAERARALQNGSIHRYLGYSFVALVAVLLAVTL